MKRQVFVGDQAVIPGIGLVTATEIVVGDYKRPSRRYVKFEEVADGQWGLISEGTWLRDTKEVR